MDKKHPLTDLAALYLANADLTLKTKNAYRGMLNRYIAFLEDRDILIAKRTDVFAYRDDLRAGTMKPDSVNRHIRLLKLFYKWLRIHQPHYDLDPVYLYDIAEGIRTQKIDRQFKKTPLSLAQIKALLKVAETKCHTIVGIRNKAIILLMVITGMRLIEVVRAKKEHASIIHNTDILYVHGKKKIGPDDFVKLPLEVVDAINDYLHLRSDRNPYLFIAHSKSAHHQPLKTNAISREIRSYMDEAGIRDPNISVYSLRHSCATINLLEGGSLQETQKLLRHQNIDTTLYYTHTISKLNQPGEDRVAKALFKGDDEDA